MLNIRTSSFVNCPLSSNSPEHRQIFDVGYQSIANCTLPVRFLLCLCGPPPVHADSRHRSAVRKFLVCHMPQGPPVGCHRDYTRRTIFLILRMDKSTAWINIKFLLAQTNSNRQASLHTGSLNQMIQGRY